MKSPKKNDVIYGMHAIIEAITAGKSIDKVLLQKGKSNKLYQSLLHLLKQNKIPCQQVPLAKLNSITQGNHHGAIALVAPISFIQITDIIQHCYEQGKDPIILLLDGITDVRNFGAMVRTALGFGVNAVVIPIQGRSAINNDAMHTSAGALAHMPICRAENLQQTITYLQESGLKVVALDAKANNTLYHADLKGPIAIIVGSEDKGIAVSYSKMADKKLFIPMTGAVASFNVGIAAAIVLSEISRQRI